MHALRTRAYYGGLAPTVRREGVRYCYVCVLILLCICPHTAMYVSGPTALLLYICPHTAMYVSARTCAYGGLTPAVRREGVRSKAAYTSSLRPHTLVA